MTGEELRTSFQGVGHAVAYYPALTRITGSSNATLLLCQLLYWRGKGKDPHGWVYKSAKEVERETGLTRHEQETARGKLRRAGLLQEEVRKVEGAPTVHFRVNWDELARRWPELHASEEEESDEAEMESRVGGNPNPPTRQSIPAYAENLHTEITTETTAESTRGRAPARASHTRPHPKPSPPPSAPASFEPDEESRAYALAAGCDPEREKAAFLNHYRKNRVWFPDPQAAFRSWIDKAPRFRDNGLALTGAAASRASPAVTQKELRAQQWREEREREWRELGGGV